MNQMVLYFSSQISHLLNTYRTSSKCAQAKIPRGCSLSGEELTFTCTFGYTKHPLAQVSQVSQIAQNSFLAIQTDTFFLDVVLESLSPMC